MLQHGLADSAYCWVLHDTELSPAFVLARAGYDVWLGNSRGNPFSRKHATLNADHDKKKYFDFSFYEMGKYDLPAMIEMIQGKTDGQKVAYIGHS